MIGLTQCARLAVLTSDEIFIGVDVDPVAYITNTLQAILDGHPQSRLEKLMPWSLPRRQPRLHR